MKPVFKGLPQTHSNPLIQVSLFEKGVLLPSKWCPDRNFDCWGPKKGFLESLRRALSRGGLRKNENPKKHTQKKRRKKWFLVSNLPLCFRPNPETGVPPFHSRSNPCFRVWPEMPWNPLIQILRENATFFTSVCNVLTLVKKVQWVFSGSRHLESFRPNP